ncbi:hypothetical protein L7F22_048845 [Adiantum nelumboides]|nr:hypothetical protein [Adiantum nelumboides]
MEDTSAADRIYHLEASTCNTSTFRMASAINNSTAGKYSIIAYLQSDTSSAGIYVVEVDMLEPANMHNHIETAPTLRQQLRRSPLITNKLQDIGVPEAIQWGTYAMYESVTGRVRAPGGLSDAIESTVGVKQGCPLTPTLFRIYIDELLESVDTYGDAGSSLAGVMIPLLLYADDVVMISDTQEGLQRQLDALQRFCADRDLTVNLGKTKVITQAWVTRTDHQFTFRGEMVEQVQSYVYLGVTFTSPRFSLKQATDARLDKGFAALGRLERQCAHV